MKFVGIDALPHEGVQYVKQGILDATFAYPTGGAEAIETALKLLRARSVPKKIVLGTRLYTKGERRRRRRGNSLRRSRGSESACEESRALLAGRRAAEAERAGPAQRRGATLAARARAEQARARAVPRAGLSDEAARGDREARSDRRSDGRRLRALGSTARTRPTAWSARTTRCSSPQLLGALAGARRPAQHRAPVSRAWTASTRASGPTRPTSSSDAGFMERLDEWCSSGSDRATPRTSIAYHAPICAEAAGCAREVAGEIRRRPPADPDARRHLDGHDQRLLRAAPA